MNWLASIGIGLVTAIIGGVLAAWIGDMGVRWQRVSTFEGAAGYAVAGLVLMALVAGLVIGIVTSRVAGPGYWQAQGLSITIVAGIIGICGFFAWLTGDQPPTLDGDTMILQAELRFPAGWEPTRAARRGKGSACWLTPLGAGNQRRTAYNGRLFTADMRQEDGLWILPAEVWLFTTRTPRLLEFVINEKTRIEVTLAVPARPDRSHLHWSPWRDDGFLKEAGKPALTGYAYRWRVLKSEDRRKAEDAEEAAKRTQRDRDFAALKPESPVTAWLRFIDQDATGEQRGAIMTEIQKRGPELAQVLRSNDRQSILRTLQAVGGYTFTFEDSLTEPVIEVGRRVVVEAVRQARAGSTKEDPDLEAQTEAKFLFSAWHETVEKAGDRISKDTIKTICEEILKISEGYDGDGEMYSIHDMARDYLRELEKQQ